jgi:tripartite-type tricarboxylate transporter receptor subunit TctC
MRLPDGRVRCGKPAGRPLIGFRRRRFLLLAAGAAALPAVSRIANAQTYPNRYVRLVVPFPPGGSADPIARVLASRLSEIWPQQVVIENKAGAGGNIAAQAVAQSPPDGYTLFIGGNFLATNVYLYSSIVDPLTDLMPVTRICTYTNVMIVPNSSPARSVKEFIEYCRANRGRVTFASSGTGASPHLNGELFKRLAGVEMTHVPYRGGGPALNDLVPGRVDAMFATLPSVIALIQSKTVRALGVASGARSPFAPDIPTIAEAGVPGFDVTDGYALFCPPRTPAGIVNKIHDDTVDALAYPPVKQRLADIGASTVTSTPTELANLVRADMKRWGPIIKELGIKAE